MRRIARPLAVIVLTGAAHGCGEKSPAPAAAPTPAPLPSPPPLPAPPVAPAPVVPAAPHGEVAPILRDLADWDAATADERRAAVTGVLPLLGGFALARIETFSAGGATHEIGVFLQESTGLEFSLVPGGGFKLGSPPSEPGRSADETEQAVRLTSPFLISRTECTQAAWDRVRTANPSKNVGPELPVESVTCYEAESFCSKARLALPTEAQWEYACRAGTQSRYATGDDPASLAEFAWFDAPKGTTHPVGGRKPNAFGLVDVHGNVWEWCGEAYGPRVGGEVTNPVREPSPSDQRVVRGGSYSMGPAAVRSAFRYRAHPGDRQPGLGFRPVRPVEWPVVAKKPR